MISRRMFIRGAGGVTVGLPMLASLLPREARGAATGVRRFVGFLTGNGVNMTKFRPSTSQLGTIDAAMLANTSLAPLSSHATRVIIPRGIHTRPVGYSQATPGDDHHKGQGHRLTAAPLDAGTELATGISIDQVIADELNPGGRPALLLEVGPRTGMPLAVSSYTGANQPVVPENNPWLAYQDMMGLSGLDEAELARMTARRQSVLDLLEGEFGWLQSKDLGAADRMKLEMHLQTIRDLEIDMIDGLVPCQLDATREAELAALDPDTVDYDAQYKNVGRMQMDLVALAIACGSTVSATLQWHCGANGPIFTWDGMSHVYNHHKLSHGNTMDDDTGAQIDGYADMVAQIDTWYATQLAYLADKLAAYEEGDGTVLDNCALVWMNDLADGKSHSYQDMPHVIVGGCGGYLQTGRHVKVTGQPSVQQNVDAGHSQLLTTLLNAVGVTADGGGPIASFGDPDYALPGELDALKA